MSDEENEWLQGSYKARSSCWTLDVSWTASYEITLVRLFVRLSVRPSLSFLKIGSLVFSHIVHGGSWPQHLVTDGARFFLKKLGGQNWAQN